MPDTLILTNNSNYEDIADAIRTKNGSNTTYKPDEMAQAILNIPTATVILKPFLIRPDAQLVKTISYDKYINADEGITIPAYTTSSTTLLASNANLDTYTIDYVNYNWFILIRTLTTPEYSVTTKAKGRTEYAIGSAMYEIAEVPANTFHALLDPTKFYTSRTASILAVGAFSRLVYWSSGTAITAYASAAYGTAQTIVAPTLSSGVITFKSPTFIIRGSSTYLSSTYFNALTDIRYQYVIELYRAPKNNLNINGWGQTQQALHMIECAQSNTGKLT